MTNTVRLHRVLRSKPERVYSAFLDGDAMVEVAAAEWLHWQGPSLDAKVGGTYKMSFTNFTTGSLAFVRRQIFGARTQSAHSLFGSIRRSESAGRDDDDRDDYAGRRRRRSEHHSGRYS